MKIAIYGQSYNSNTKKSIHTLLDFLLLKKIDVTIEHVFFGEIQRGNSPKKYSVFKTFKSLDHSFELLISIGGDGTILRAVTFVRNLSIPIVGINTGRLGFLSTIQTDEIKKAINQVLNGNYKISERTLLSVETNPENKDIISLNFALNEVAVSRKNTTAMIKVETHLNSEYLTSYWSDGLIISTPTGSTGYSLSCGGPIITPQTDSLVLTPIAPHNLSARPLVIPNDTEIKLKVDGREEFYLISLDSRLATLHNSTIVTIKKASFKIKMVELLNESFIDTLRKKMLWGEDKRN